MDSDGEMRVYLRKSFEEKYGNLEHFNVKVAIFQEASPDTLFRSWVGTIIVTFIASYSIILYFVLGYKIMSYLKQGVSFMSPRTMNMQKRSFWALFVQTVIPICVSFMPCTIALYGSVFRLEFSSSINYMSSIAISTFPFLDPLAITMCLPALRRRLFQNMGIKISQNPST
ncbi:hypothetical protein B9Z55_018182 [Caenorhabditis nigoni]|uniref:Uncharacterized protein n=1 Tax=Caenorhabditis nigoni TaxID=1611254 RepID=A0A2G5TCN9_9PELO|nr:hypothetical protein B9Z55_018182 [Caenorhabditis nigoni]